MAASPEPSSSTAAWCARSSSKSTRTLAAELAERGHVASYKRVGENLHALHYSLQASAKVIEGAQHPDRVSPHPTHRKGFSFHPLLCHLDDTGDALRGCCGGETPAPTLPSHKAKVVRLYVPFGVFSSRRSSKRTAQSEGSIRRYLADFRQILRPAGTRATPRPRASSEA